MKPLEGVRVIAIEQYGAGPFGTLHLADLGAEIIKIEDPRTGGDVGRYVPPFADGEDSLFFETFNRNKKSLSLDISTEAGREVFHDLVRTADAVYSNLRGDVPKRLGLTYDDLEHVNPRIVCCSLSAFGMTGPRAQEPGYDYIMQGLAGWMSLAGEPDGPPTKTGLSMVDYSGGFVAAISLLAGILSVKLHGQGMDCDVSLYDTAMHLLTYPATWHLNEGWTPERHSRSAHPSLVPFQNFPTADGWMVVGCAKEKFWQRLVEAIGRGDLAEDPRFVDFTARNQHREQVIAELDRTLAQRTTAEWVQVLTAAGVPCSPINDVPAAMREEHTAARSLVVEHEHEAFGTVKTLASPVRLGPPGQDQYGYRRAPHRNEHADEILTGLLGYDEARVAELTGAGAFGADGEQG